MTNNNIVKEEKDVAHCKNNNKKFIDPDFFEYYETRDQKLRNRLLEKNRPLVTYIVSKYYSNKKEHQMLHEDLLQEGIIGLISAIDGYRPELGYRFATYSSWWIRQAINNYILYVEPTIHIPSHIRTANNKLSKKMRDENISYQAYIESYQNSDYSEKMLCSMNCANKVRFISSFEDIIGNKDGSNGDANNSTLKDILPAPENKQSDIQLDSANMIDIVRKSLDKLPPREQYLLLLRFDVIRNIPNTNKKKNSKIKKNEKK